MGGTIRDTPRAQGVVELEFREDWSRINIATSFTAAHTLDVGVTQCSSANGVWVIPKYWQRHSGGA